MTVRIHRVHSKSWGNPSINEFVSKTTMNWKRTEFLTLESIINVHEPIKFISKLHTFKVCLSAPVLLVSFIKTLPGQRTPSCLKDIIHIIKRSLLNQLFRTKASAWPSPFRIKMIKQLFERPTWMRKCSIHHLMDIVVPYSCEIEQRL